jgi:hypothetical protein
LSPNVFVTCWIVTTISEVSPLGLVTASIYALPRLIAFCGFYLTSVARQGPIASLCRSTIGLVRRAQLGIMCALGVGVSMASLARIFGAALFLAQLPGSSPASAQAAPQWVVDESGYYCALATKVTGPPDATLVLRTLPGTWTYDMMLVGDRWPPRITGAHKQIAFALFPGTASEARAPEEAFLDRDRMLALRGLGGRLIEDFPRSNALEVRVDGKAAVRYALPSNAAEASQALARCIASKLIEAGADPAGFERGATPPTPVGDRNKWLDLPPVLSMGDGEGVHAAVLLDLDPAGKPTDCIVLELVGRLDRQRVCQNLLQRARYEPARDAKGKALRSIAVYDLDEIVHVKVEVETFAG